MNSKLENTNNKIYLIGPMGSGKSTIGHKLAKMLNYDFIDLDHEIENTTGAKISLIFELEKEEGFRKRETQELQKTIDVNNAVISTGGGIVLLKENRSFLKNNGYNIYLKANIDTIYKRVANKKTRPLLQVDNPRQEIKNILKQRQNLYNDVCNYYVNTDNKNTKSIINEILNKLKQNEDNRS